MIDLNYGFQNEYDFVELFNGKCVGELDENSRCFLEELFETRLVSEEKIKAWKNRANQKADIFIKYKNYVRGVSLKCGNSNSIHHEGVQEFKMFLEELNIPYKVIDYYFGYHYGYKRDDNGELDFSVSLSSEEYKSLYQEEIDVFNREINKTKIVIEMVDRFLIRGRNSRYDIDAFICGTTDDYVWILKSDLYDLILEKRNAGFTSPHIGPLTIGPKKRNLDRKSKNGKERYIVCIRWNFIREDIVGFKEKRTR